MRDQSRSRKGRKNMEHETEQGAAAAVSSGAPPYVSYATFKTLLEDMQTNGVPPQVDRSTLTRFSGGVGAQLLVALKYLGLVDKERHPTPDLKRLVDTLGTEHFAANLRDVLSRAYPFMEALDLTTATPAMFAKAFTDNSSAKEDVLRKSRTFYLNAAREAGIELGPRLQNVRMPRGSGGSARKRPRKTASGTSGRVDQKDPQSNPPYATKSVEQQLVDKFPDFDPEWPDEIKASWFAGFKQLMDMTSQTKGGAHE